MIFKEVNLVDTTPGSLSNICEIKILICCVLNCYKTQILSKLLHEAFQLTGIVNYFNFCFAIKELLNSKLIAETVDKNDKNKTYYSVTKLGVETAKIFKNNITITAFEKITKALEKLIEKERQNKNRKILIEQKEDGFIVKLILEETGSNLLDLELFCPTRSTAQQMKAEMELKTTEIYGGILSILSDDSSALQEIVNNLKVKKSKKSP